MSKTYLTHHLPGRTVRTSDSEEFLWFGGTDYLGMGHNPKFLHYLNEGFQQYGTHFGSSRNNTLQLEVYREAEILFAAFTESPDALLTSSGMWAGQLVANYCAELATKEPTDFYYAPYTHPALRSREALIDNSCSWSDWAKKTIELINSASDDTTHFIFTDSVRSPLPELHDFSPFEQLSVSKRIYLIIDDSHGFGVLGQNGRGINALLSTLPSRIEPIIVSSLNKAMGIPAGIILGNSSFLEKIRRSPWFSGSSPASPAYIVAATNLLKDGVYEAAHTQLISNINHFTTLLHAPIPLSSASNYPVFCCTDESLHTYLIEKGILTTCFPYPSPQDNPLVRMVVSTCHTKEDLNFLADALNEFFKEKSFARRAKNTRSSQRKP